MVRLGASTGLLSAALWARRSQPLILMYHGVTEQQRFEGLQNAAELHLPECHFIAHLRLLRRLRRVISISELLDGLRHGDDLRNTVVLTFDDGYENNVTHAAPILADYKMPASFFLATGFIGSGRWAWTDRVEYALDITRADRLIWQDAILPLTDMHTRRHTLHAVKARLKLLPVAERDEQLSAIEYELNIPPSEPKADYRFMNWAQARTLADAGFDVGAHTINHAILSRVSPSDAEAEIVGSKNAVVAGIGSCSPIFCYPNGKKQDYDETTISICSRHFQAAITTEHGCPDPNSLFELPRQSAGGDGIALTAALLRAA